MFRYYFIPFFQAWEILVNLPIPESVKSKLIDDEDLEEDIDQPTILLACPIVGAIIGLCIYLSGILLVNALGKLAGALLFGLIIEIFLEIITSGRGLASTVFVIESLLHSATFEESLNQIDDEWENSRNTTGILALIILFLLRVFCLGSLVYGGRLSWIIVTLTLSCTVQGNLATESDLETGESFIDIEGENSIYKILWLITAAILFVVGYTYLLAALIALVISWMLAYHMHSYCRENLGGISTKIITFTGYGAETIILLIGILKN